ncbi:hypothetical protein GCM10010503_44970 [Streptomyces lucensis JCM 4490]|uniref:Uncharacterized protein n=1 Tax=Streptomyces lucensis JCM 4490 TaxID=1306176 RepID=A0A918J9V2_9ACTN|nr:hypothetical protein [Streptomyces lucensis]GGW62664.1 hypothetical protein GCM10010503_44970 [Streptomyces lucensis JCM 4490]
MAARGRTRWGPVAAVLALPVALLTGLVVMVVAWLRPDAPLGGESGEVPCAEALSFGGARLPKGARDTSCTVRSWMDTDYVARFRMPREDVRDWLRATYPDAPDPGTRSCHPHSVDLCLDLGLREEDWNYAGRVPGRTDPGFGAFTVDVDITCEGRDTALVVFSAFTS